VLARGVLAVVLALAGVILIGGVLVLLRAVGDEVVGVSTTIASFLQTTTTLVIQAVIVKPQEPVDDQCQLVVPKGLQLLLYDRHQRRHSKQHL
jgi:drug/metabolite transporter (DMT)-like permease